MSDSSPMKENEFGEPLADEDRFRAVESEEWLTRIRVRAAEVLRQALTASDQGGVATLDERSTKQAFSVLSGILDDMRRAETIAHEATPVISMSYVFARDPDSANEAFQGVDPSLFSTVLDALAVAIVEQGEIRVDGGGLFRLGFALGVTAALRHLHIQKEAGEAP